MGDDAFVFDKENLLKAAKFPLIIAVVLGLTFLLRVYLGYLYGLATVVLSSFVGASYMKAVMDSGRIPLFTNVAINSAI